MQSVHARAVRATVTGQSFPASTSVAVTGQIPLVTGQAQSVSQGAQAGANGSFTLSLPIPGNAADGTVTLTASASGANSQTVTATATVTVTHTPASITVSSVSAFPGEQLTVSGSTFASGPGALITVVETYAGSNGQVSQTQTVDASASGAFTTTITVPTNAVPGMSTITATQTTGGQTASTTLVIQAPAATPTPTPANGSPVHLRIKFTSVWYRAVRLGTFDHVTIQTNKKMALPVTMRVLYPWGGEVVYSGRTTARGRWSKTFPVPATGRSRPGVARIQITVRRNFTATETLRVTLVR